MKKQAFLVIGLFLLFLFFNFEQAKQNQESNNLQAVVNLEDILEIKKINVYSPIIFSDSNDESVLQKNLESGVVHLFKTANPGEVGNVYIIGHSSDYAFSAGVYKKVFEKLEQLEIQDEIVIIYQNKTFKYLVYDKKIVHPSDLSVLSQDTQGRKFLTLQTSYPVNSIKNRLLILAELQP